MRAKTVKPSVGEPAHLPHHRPAQFYMPRNLRRTLPVMWLESKRGPTVTQLWTTGYAGGFRFANRTRSYRILRNNELTDTSHVTGETDEAPLRDEATFAPFANKRTGRQCGGICWVSCLLLLLFSAHMNQPLLSPLNK